ncbi:alpha/beta fold hydrolase [Pseudobdellovibrio exovorus]|uniref:AB hydrolase-1 domain-containing protein n=1 Tax=Pseudobdellovibrio exovorus JSS TaxID=1184267 RepID=M4VT49_9BACT|nr:alpha/beta hydrolase [Pseudobdellovibrio exovorus]AGH96384.1 hypothetical protein A11Q_2168 [Pseudobdellovibrio exovorus JSS]
MAQTNNPHHAPQIFPRKWVLLRGLMRSQFHWLDFAEKIQTELQLEDVVSVELAGNGFLHTEETPHRIEVAVEQLRSQVSFLQQKISTQQQMSASPEIGLIGISMGGMIATRWAQMYPQEVSSLVLINSSSSLSPFYQRLLPRNYFPLLRQLLIGGADAAAIEHFVLSHTSNDSTKWSTILSKYIEFQKQHPASFKNFIRQLRLTSQVDFKIVPNGKKLVLAAKEDRFVSVQCSQKIAAAWNCPVAYHTTAGHDLPLDAPDWIIQQIKKWSQIT